MVERSVSRVKEHEGFIPSADRTAHLMHARYIITASYSAITHVSTVFASWRMKAMSGMAGKVCRAVFWAGGATDQSDERGSYAPP